MYKQVSAQYLENNVANSHKFIDDAMQYCLDVVNYENGEIIDIKVETCTDPSYGRYGTVIIIYKAAKSDEAPSTEEKSRFAGSLAAAFK
jgi:hypothetical protein